MIATNVGEFMKKGKFVTCQSLTETGFPFKVKLLPTLMMMHNESACKLKNKDL